MAGAGFKTFNTGDVLTASDVNTYLMQQTVMVFADASARSTALGANVAEGMISYLKDTNAVERYDGSSWGAIGAGDIEGVTAGAGLTGGGTSGTVTLSLNSLSAGRNAIINGGMDIWQRGTSFSITSTATYTLDRWQVLSLVNAGTLSRQATGDTTNLPFIQYGTRVQRPNGNTGTNDYYLSQSLETANSLPFAGRTVTLSFYARRGANYSASGNALSSVLVSGTGTDQNFWAGYTGQATVATQSNTLTTDWQRFSVSGTVASTATELAIYFSFTPTGTAGANDWFEVTGVQLELGSSATPFSRAGGTIQGELAACQRYYQVFNRDNFALIGSAYSTSAAAATPVFYQQMRTAPTITLATAGSGSGQMSFLTSAAGVPSTIGTFAAENITASGFRLTGSGFTSGFTAGNAPILWCGSSSVDVWKASAEL